MAEELRFIDPAVSCEVVLRKVSRALYVVAEDQFERLRKVRNLGLAGQFHPAATHSRHDHLVGLMRLFEKLLLQPHGDGLPKKTLWSFWCRLCFGQTGHAAFSYDAEKAVLLACQLDPSFRQEFVDFLAPVTEEASVTGSETGAGSSAAKSKRGAEWLAAMIDGNNWKRVHLWVAALKLIQHARLGGVLSQEEGKEPGFDRRAALDILVNPESEWDDKIVRLNCLDAVVRDLTFTGRMNLVLDVDRLVATVNVDDPMWGLLESLGKYLTATMYASPERQMESALFQRALAERLTNGAVSLEELFGIDHRDCLSDDDLKARMLRTTLGKQIFDQEIRQGWHTWHIRAAIDKEKPPCTTEMELLSQKSRRTYLSSPSRQKVLCYKMLGGDALGLAIRHRGNVDRSTPATFLRVCRALSLHQHAVVNPSDLFQATSEAIIGRRITHAIDSMITLLSDLELETDALKRAANYVHGRYRPKGQTIDQLSLVIGGKGYPISGQVDDLFLSVMHAALVSDPAMQNRLGMPARQARAILWSHLLSRQSVYFKGKVAVVIANLLRDAQRKLGARTARRQAGAAQDLETYTFLEALLSPATEVSFRIVLPNFTVMSDENKPENEYDVVSLMLRTHGAAEAWVWGVTCDSNVQKKQRDDLAKIQKLKNILGTRWGGEIRTVTNYVHLDRHAICVEVDGRQDKRAFGKSATRGSDPDTGVSDEA